MFYLIRTVILYLLFVQITYASSLTPLTGISKLSVGNTHTCIVTTNGGAKCWGSNGGGELGNGTTSFQNSLTPVDVTGLTSGVKNISAGNSYTCALTVAGGVKCWGDNHNGQLGDGTTTRRTTPVDVTGLTSGVKDIFAGYYSTCALTTSGGVKCWGNNQSGQLGNGGVVDKSLNSLSTLNTPYYKSTPSDVIGLTSGAIAVSVSLNHACALTTAGGVKCWGVNVNGELGNSTYNSHGSNTPVNVTGLTNGVVAISSGYEQTCALTTSGGVKCWGANYKGQLGDNTTTERKTPVSVSGLTSGVKSISSGSYHACALTTSGGVKCWGDNSKGQLGDNTITQRISPIDVIGANNSVTAIATGGSHSCLIGTGNNVKCWGNNGNGQLGDNTIIQRSTPVTVLTNEVTPCTATISPNLSIHIPKLEAAGTFWWADLTFQPTNDGRLHFMLQNAGITTDTSTGICATASETLVVHISNANYGTMKLWANLVYLPTNDGKDHFILQDYGLLNP